jgi:hypothetical protein
LKTINVNSNRNFMWAFGKDLRTSCIIKTRMPAMSPAFPEGPDGAPGPVAYQPIKFPSGLWIVGRPVPTTHPLMAPYFIPTNAHQIVTCVDGSQFDDYGYGIHFDAQFESTWGCLHLYSAEDATWLAEQILAAEATGEPVGVMVA